MCILKCQCKEIEVRAAGECPIWRKIEIYSGLVYQNATQTHTHTLKQCIVSKPNLCSNNKQLLPQFFKYPGQLIINSHSTTNLNSMRRQRRLCEIGIELGIFTVHRMCACMYECVCVYVCSLTETHMHTYMEVQLHTLPFQH